MLTGSGYGGKVQADLIDSSLIHGDQRGLHDSQQEFLLLKEDLPFVGRHIHVHTL